MTQEQLAEKLEISIKHLSTLETGKVFASSELIEKIAEELKVSISALFYTPDEVAAKYNVGRETVIAWHNLNLIDGIKIGNELMSLLNNSEKKKKVGEIVIEEGCGNDLRIDLKICGMDNLKKLTVKKNSLKNLKSLVVSNNENLENIDIENEKGEEDEKEDGYEYSAAFENVKSVEISSII